MLVRSPKQGYLAACGALKRADLRPFAGAIAVPTLCLVGEEDGSTPVALVRETADLIDGSRFEVIAGAGHIPGIEKPDATAELLRRAREKDWGFMTVRPLRKANRPALCVARSERL